MKKISRLGMFAFLGVALATCLVGCKDDDPDYSDVEAPTVAVTYSISGLVTDMSGAALSGATVTMDSQSTTTSSAGVFEFEDVTAGDHTLTASYTGKQTKETTVTVSSSATHPTWTVSLPSEGTTTTISSLVVTTTETGETEGGETVASETVEGNDDGAVEVTVTVTEDFATALTVAAEEAGVEAEAIQITITPIYSEAEAETKASTRATESTLLIGTTVSCSADIAWPTGYTMDLTYDVDSSLSEVIEAYKYVDGSWVDADFTVSETGHVVVEADGFTSYALYFEADVTTSTSSQALSFAQDSWDNLYGSSSVSVGSASYTYYLGTNISTTASNKLQAYLIEILARLAGSTYTENTGSYPLNVTLPAGAALEISGSQALTNYTVSAEGTSATGVQYGNVTISTYSYTNAHIGSSSN